MVSKRNAAEPNGPTCNVVAGCSGPAVLQAASPCRAKGCPHTSHLIEAEHTHPAFACDKHVAKLPA